MTKLNNIKNTIMTNPLTLVVITLFVLVIFLTLVRLFLPSFSTGVDLKAHFGSLKGNINFEAFENNGGPQFVAFTAEWCGHCKKCMPDLLKLQQENLENVSVIIVDSDKDTELVKQHKIQGFPTIRMYPQGLNNIDNYKEFNGERNLDGFKSFIQNSGN